MDECKQRSTSCSEHASFGSSSTHPEPGTGGISRSQTVARRKLRQDGPRPSAPRRYFFTRGTYDARLFTAKLFGLEDNMSILDKIEGKDSKDRRREVEANEKRPIKFVQERTNVWRIVYAD